MEAKKAELLADLKAARNDLWAALEPIDPDTEIYPGWKKRDFFAHIGGWEALVYGAFRDYLAGVPGKGVYPFANMDEANAHFVGVRKSMTLVDTKLECEIYRYAIEQILLQIPAEDYGKTVQLPWGGEIITDFLRGAIRHEEKHTSDIRQLRKG
jgi:hypothetical protein